MLALLFALPAVQASLLHLLPFPTQIPCCLQNPRGGPASVGLQWGQRVMVDERARQNSCHTPLTGGCPSCHHDSFTTTRLQHCPRLLPHLRRRRCAVDVFHSLSGGHTWLTLWCWNKIPLCFIAAMRWFCSLWNTSRKRGPALKPCTGNQPLCLWLCKAWTSEEIRMFPGLGVLVCFIYFCRSMTNEISRSVLNYFCDFSCVKGLGEALYLTH